MNTYAIRSALVSTLGVALALGSGSALATTYRLTDLGTLGGTRSSGAAINASGHVTGYAETADGDEHAFLWDGTRMQDLGTLGGTYSYGVAINEAGQVTGYAYTAGGWVARHAFLWDGATLQDLGTFGGATSSGTAINDSGQVTGSAETADGDEHAFLWDGTTLQDLGTFGGATSSGTAINASGQVTGYAQIAGDVARHAFLWDGATLQDLGTFGGATSSGTAINDSGQVTGSAETVDRDTTFSRAFLWDGTTMQDLGTLTTSSYSFGYLYGVAINDSGQVTGSADTWDGGSRYIIRHAFLWDGTTMQDLGTLTSPYSSGVAINASGQVTGYTFILVYGPSAFRNPNLFPPPNVPMRISALLWDGTTLHDLNALIDPADPLQPFVTLLEGVDINDRGQVVANGTDSRTGEEHAYVVSPPAPTPPPVPTPPTVESSGGGGGAFDVIVALALLGLALTRRRSAV